MTFRIAQISDTHLSDDKPFFVDSFARVGEALRADRPDLVLNSGDISLDGTANESDLAAARALHGGLGLPLRFLPGNHDLGDSQDGPTHGEKRIDAARRARYVAHFGDDWWTFDVPGWRVLGINAQLLASDLGAAGEQNAAIAASVVGIDGRKLALFLHRPMFDRDIAESEVGGRFVNPASRRMLLSALGGVVPALVASGHVHQFRDSWFEGTHHVWAPSTAFVIPDSRQPVYGVKDVGYVEHRLAADGGHESRFVKVPGLPLLSIADFPGAYGPP
ncbi:MAG: metallophosphoesterase [Reyranellaceae bacterium]